MLTLHLTGSPWFLLLLPPGLFILWRQYRQGALQSGPPFAGRILFFLQALPLLILTLSLTAPELQRHRVEFHNPAVLILRDQSGSFQNGAYLGLADEYANFERALSENYRNRKFDVRVADFHEGAWPVSGFRGQGGQSAKSGEASSLANLTSLAAAADFVDSAAIPNLQAIFLFSDGRANLDSSKASRSWSAPLFPVTFSADSIGEVQPERISMVLAPGGKTAEVTVAWRSVSGKSVEPALQLQQGGKVLLQRKLPAANGSSGFTFSWSPGKALSDERLPIKALLQPAKLEANFNPFNDTVSVAFPGGRTQASIYVLRPVHSLDEKGMLDILFASELEHIAFFGMDELGGLRLTAKDQVWLEAGALSKSSRLLTALKGLTAQVVIYVRTESDGEGRDLPGLPRTWREFSSLAEIKVSKSAAEAFPDEVVRLKGLTEASLKMPELVGTATSLVEVAEGGRRGILMGRITLSGGKSAFVFLLPRIWNSLFDPQSDFTVRANIAAYIRTAKSLAGFDEGALRVSRPSRIYAQVPFDMDFHVPGPGVPGSLVLSITGTGNDRKLPSVAQDNFGELKWHGLLLPEGKYRMALDRGEETLWSDTLEVASKAALELARIGFDDVALEESARRSGGRLLVSDSHPHGRKDSTEVLSMLPKLPAAQIRMDKTQAYRLYNTLFLFLAVLVCLSISWYLRKKWDLD